MIQDNKKGDTGKGVIQSTCHMKRYQQHNAASRINYYSNKLILYSI